MNLMFERAAIAVYHDAKKNLNEGRKKEKRGREMIIFFSIKH